MKKVILILFIVILTSCTVTEAPTITSNPINLEQTASISQFRSCIGHDYSGYNEHGEKETQRTMKHYIEVSKELDQSTGLVEVYAPFNGEIVEIEEGSRGVTVWISEEHAQGWHFIFHHIDLLDGFEEGSVVHSGEKIAYANLKDGANFDISMKHFSYKQRFVSPFVYMTEEVLQEYADVGVTLENIILTKEYRDAAPCDYEKESYNEEEIVYLSSA